MGLNHLEMHFTENAAPYIDEAGGKIGGLNYLRETVPALKDAILPVQVIGPDENLTDITVPASDSGSYIVRGSHPMDFQGLVNVLATEVGDKRNLARLVHTVQRKAQSPDVMSYAKYENPVYNGRIFVGVQPYIYCQKGSVVEHPNIPNSYVISFVNQGYQTGQDCAITGIYQAEKDQFEHISGFFDEIEGGSDTRAKQIVDLYKETDYSGLVKPGYSFQMEFLNSPDQVYIAQVRAFKEKKEADFELKAKDRLVFGVTSPKGVTLPVYLSPDGFIYGDLPDNSKPWAYLKPCEPDRFSRRDIFHPKSDAEKEADALRFRPENLAAYLIGQSFSSQVNTSLEHNHFRMAQKADLTVFEGQYDYRGDFTRLFYSDPGEDMRKAHDRLYSNLISMGTMGVGISEMMTSMFQGKLMYRVKIVSDGRTAIVEPVEPSNKRRS